MTSFSQFHLRTHHIAAARGFYKRVLGGPRAAMAKAKLFNVADSIHNVLRSEEKNLPSS